MPHFHIPNMFNLTLHVCANFSYGEHWYRCASRGWSSPTQHTTSQMIFKPIFWTKTCYYSDESMFTALVHTALDSLGFRYQLCSQGSYSFILAHLANIVTIWILTKQNRHTWITCLQFACWLVWTWLEHVASSFVSNTKYRFRWKLKSWV